MDIIKTTREIGKDWNLSSKNHTERANKRWISVEDISTELDKIKRDNPDYKYSNQYIEEFLEELKSRLGLDNHNSQDELITKDEPVNSPRGCGKRISGNDLDGTYIECQCGDFNRKALCPSCQEKLTSEDK